MAIDKTLRRKILKDGTISLFIYALPVVAVYLYFAIKGETPWLNEASAQINVPAVFSFIKPVFTNLQSWGFIAIALVLGIAEFALGLYDNKWTKTERAIDIVCFIAPKILLVPVTAFFGLKLLPFVLPGLANHFWWVPFWGGSLIIAVADDLTQYWYHRLHHQVPFMWRFHRTHHSAPYMGMAMASRQNFLYTVFFSQIYLTATLVYLGLGPQALFVTVIKSVITLSAHSSIAWDKPFYKYKILHPFAWVLERLISTPATHHAHHADTFDDGVGYYKGNFGNMFFIWDVIFGTGLITRKYPSSYGISFYKAEEWQAQFLWPIFKSKKEGSELSKNGPEVGDEVPTIIQEHPIADSFRKQSQPDFAFNIQ
ncbi:sterol desaturase family protein [Ferruginibacter albus]|uniref:sterol desaturase family protein n=1 Tax=Ferruginibacter albus TaxID=2875540 RepID=UPI001CC42FC0|nr:sterol desaturase family protein [Ferruginibacter albus]UAY52038.1 sterol desaturase family protein [Ferruginibacter albus]